MEYQIHSNGSWDLIGNDFQIRNLFPSLNSTGIRPVQVLSAAGNSQIRYLLESGSVLLCFEQEPDRIKISCHLEGLSQIHDAEPAADGIFNAASGETTMFVQGFGMEGPSGCVRLNANAPEDDTYTSNGLTAFCHGDRILLFYAEDHSRFINRYRIQAAAPLFGKPSFRFSCGFDLEGTAPDILDLPDLYVEEHHGESLEEVLRGCARRIARRMHARTLQPPAYHWCSWYYLYQNFSQQHLEEYLPHFSSLEPDFRYIQIDAGYCPSLGDWLVPNHLFPDGLRHAAETIRRYGFRPGIWIAPFIVGDQSQLYRNHPEWILRDRDDQPLVQLRSYNEPKAWANPDGNYFILDTSHPGAMEYLRTVFRTLREWGFALFKTDFMFWNMHDSSQVKRFDPSRTSVEILRDTLQMIREEIGEESYLLGCIAPFLPFIGYADGMRIAGDVGAQWEGPYGPENMLRELQMDNYFQNVYWQNDPDSVLLRDFDIFLKPRETEALALLQALSGGVVTTSDPLHLLSSERRALLNFIKPDRRMQPSLPYFGRNRKDLVLTCSLPHGKLLYTLNCSDEPLTVLYPFGELFSGNAEAAPETGWYVLQWKNPVLSDPDAAGPISPDTQVRQTMLAFTLQPHEGRLSFLTSEPLTRMPENLWRW